MVHEVRSVIMFQAHPLLALGDLGNLGRQSPSKNLSGLGTFVGPYAGDLDKFPRH